MKTLFILLMAFLPLSSSTIQQEGFFCAYDYNNLSTRIAGQVLDLELSDYAGNDGLAHVVDRIKSIAGMGNDFQVYFGGGFKNAYATKRQGEDWIIIDIDYLEEINAKTGTDWGGISVIAHEIGHHYYHHMSRSLGQRAELEADYFSGRILKTLGASMEASVQAMALIGSENGSGSHPDKFARIKSIQRGWREGF